MSFHQVVGDQSFGVQISGDQNTVVVHAGAARLALARPQRRKAEPKTELELLRVDRRATTLVGRDTDLAALEAWLAADRQIALRCLKARAGTGKTRLGVELCERAEGMNWTAGFVQTGAFQEFVRLAADWRWITPTLVVVDYAASFARELRQWLEFLAAGEHDGAPKLRLLLLERHAEAEQGWWADLMRPTSFSAAGPDEFADPREPVALASLGRLEDRHALLAETMKRAGGLAVPPRVAAPPPPGADPDFDRRLADDAIDNEPLYLMMAGVEAVHAGAPGAVRLGRTDLAGRAAGRERERLERLAAGWRWPEGLLPHLALCVTLQGGCQADAVATLLDEERTALGFASPGPPHRATARLADALPTSATTTFDGLRPDLVGEAFVLLLMRSLGPGPAVRKPQLSYRRNSLHSLFGMLYADNLQIANQ